MRIGRSLAMNSEKRLTRKTARKIQSDQKPRRLARKFARRRRVSGVSRMKRKRCARGAGAAAVSRSAVMPSGSCPPAREVDARVDQHVGNVADEAHDEGDQRVD